MTATELRLSPYKGLGPYTETDVDAAFFFGREAEEKIVAANLFSTRLTLLYGPSGAGKSSLVLAGAVNPLRKLSREYLKDEDANDFAVVVVRSWSDPDPLKTIAAAVRAEVVALLALLGRHDAPDPPPRATLAEVLDHWSKQLAWSPFIPEAEQMPGKLLVLFDQFEEYFLYHGPEAETGAFDHEFPQAVNRVNLRANFLLSIRDDALSGLDRFKAKIPKLFDERLHIDCLTLKAARDAVKKPIDEYNRGLPAEQQVEIADGFVEAVLAECAVKGPAGGESPDAINAPALQLVLERLWRDAAEAGEHTLNSAELEKLHGVKGILENQLHAALASFSPSERDIVARCFVLLAGSTKTKVAYPASVLATVAGRDEPEVTAVLDKLGTGGTRRILNAVDKNYELFNADLLAEPVIEWQKEHDEEQRRRAEEERRRALRRKYRNRTIVLVTLAAVFAAIAGVAVDQYFNAKHATTRARSIALASTANTELATRPDISLLLSLAAYDTRKSVEAASSMMSALEAAQRSGARAILHGHTDQVTAVAYSPDGRTLASGSWDSTVRLWDVATHTQLGEPLLGHTDTVNSVAFSPDGHTLATGSDDKTVRLWDVATPKHRGEALRSPKGGAVNSVAFSPDGRTLASGDDKGKVWLWDVSTQKQRGEALRGRKGGVLSLAFSPDGRTLASGSSGTVLLWDVSTQTPTRLGQLRGPEGVDWPVAFSPDRRTLATATTDDDTVRLWDVRTQKQRGKPLVGHKGGVLSLAFSADGRLLASGSIDKTVRLWDVGTQKPHGEALHGHTDRVPSVAFSPDGRTVASGSFDTTVRLWDVSTRRTQLGQPLLGQKGRIVGLAFSPDGHTLATGSYDNTVWLWDLRKSPPHGHRLPGKKGDIYGVDFSRDGRILAIGQKNGTVRLWSLVENASLGKPLRGDKKQVNAVAFSPDGSTLASGGDDNRVWLWDLRTNPPHGRPLPRRKGHVYSVAFSPDGRTVASSGADNNVWLWDVDSHKQLGKPLSGHFGPVYSVAFSPDGHTLATGGYDSTARLWDVRTHAQLGQPLHHRNIVYSVAFSSPDGRILVTGDDTNTVQLWDVRTHAPLGKPLLGHKKGITRVAFSSAGRKLATGDAGGRVLLWGGFLETTLADLRTRVCGLVANLTPAEWQQFVPGLPYRTTCHAPAADRGAQPTR